MPAPNSDDVSLYDFARTAAALAVCLDSVQNGTEEAGDEEPVLLIGADLSGVQDWLYTLSSDGAAKSLRGRSVYLQLLMEVIALDLLRELGLPTANLLYVGGGNFYLIVPRSKQAQIERYRQLAARRLLSMHEGALYLALASASLPKQALREATVG